MARLQAVSAQFRVARLSTAEATHRAIVGLAKREHAKVLASDPKPGGFTRYVDGRKGAREEAVKPTGVIVYEYQRLDLVVQLAMETLFDKSPVLSGAYRNAHTLFLNGVPVRNLAQWKAGDEVAAVVPLWPNLTAQASIMGAQVRRIALRTRKAAAPAAALRSNSERRERPSMSPHAARALRRPTPTSRSSPCPA
jgi:hypothetical protein